MKSWKGEEKERDTRPPGYGKKKLRETSRTDADRKQGTERQKGQYRFGPGTRGNTEFDRGETAYRRATG